MTAAAQQRMADAITAFFAEVRKQANAAGALVEETLTGPCRDLLKATAQIVGGAQFTIVDKAPVPGTGYPDMAVFNSRGQIVVYVELKAPGKGADPASLSSEHDRRQWQRYSLLDNIVYTDGLEWALYRRGNRTGPALQFGDDLTASIKVTAEVSQQAVELFSSAFSWTPSAVNGPIGLARTCARYCKMLRDEIAAFGPDVPGLPPATRQALFPDLADDAFADAYAQAVTFAILAAAGLDLRLDASEHLHLRLYDIARNLRRRRGVLGEALHLLTYNEEIHDRLGIYMEALLALVESVDWDSIRSREGGSGTEWLHFYEDFLGQYDRTLRRQSGSYYTPVPVVEWMTQFTDQLLTTRFDKQHGFANQDVTVVDPATGTGTFLLGVIDRIEETVQSALGKGAVAAALSEAAASRLIGFEVQAGPYTVAQLRIAERLAAAGATSATRVYFTDTLDSPFSDIPAAQSMFEQFSQSRTAANRVKRSERVTVVIGNPPYKARATGRGGWVEMGDHGAENGCAILDDWRPPPSWELGAHAKHLSNLYVYFWRWATWKAFEQPPEDELPPAGMVSFIAPTAFLTGPGFARMRAWLREWSTEMWVLHLTPEGHQAPKSHQIFGAMRQPVGIVTAIRNPNAAEHRHSATVRFFRVQPDTAEHKYEEVVPLVDPDSALWTTLPTAVTVEELRAPFDLPASHQWSSAPAFDDVFPWNGNGVMIGRTWPVAPQRGVLEERWTTLIGASGADSQADLFKEHRQDRPVDRPLLDNLLDPPVLRPAINREDSVTPRVVPYRWRSFDRQHLIADKRVINRPNPSLWAAHGDQQQYLMVPAMSTDNTRPLVAKSAGLPIAFSTEIPDMDCLHGKVGRVHPLWRDRDAQVPNVNEGLLEAISSRRVAEVTTTDLFAYAAAVVAHPDYIARFRTDLENASELRLPIAADASAFDDAVELGREVVAAHCFDGNVPAAARVATPIPTRPQELRYERDSGMLVIVATGEADGRVGPVSPAVASLTVAQMNVLQQWFRARTDVPSGRATSPLDRLRRDWSAADTTELLELVAVLERVTALFDRQAELLNRILSHDTLTVDQLTDLGALPVSAAARSRPPSLGTHQASLLD